MNKQFNVSRFHPSSFRLHPCTWWSELESNQPFGLFRPALIRLSYPTRDIDDCQFSIADLNNNFAFQSAIGIRQLAMLITPSAFARYALYP